MDNQALTLIESVILSFLASSGVWAAVTVWLNGKNKRSAAALAGDIKKATAAAANDNAGTQNAQQVLMKNQQEDRATTASTIDHLRKEVDAGNVLVTNANAQATLAFAQSVEATKDNTKLQLTVQALQIAQTAYQARVEVLEKTVNSLTDTNTGLTSQIGGLTKTNDLLLAQVTDLKNLNRDLTAQVKALQTTNDQLQQQIKQLVDVVQTKTQAEKKE